MVALSSKNDQRLQQKSCSVDSYTCLFCPRAFATTRSLADHVRRAHDRACGVCPVCGRVLPHEAGLVSHIKAHIRRNSIQVGSGRTAAVRKKGTVLTINTKCSVCGEVMRPCDGGAHVCPQGGQKLPERMEKERQQREREEIGNVEEKDEEKEVVEGERFKGEMEQREKPHKCQLCPKSYTIRTSLARHFKLMHKQSLEQNLEQQYSRTTEERNATKEGLIARQETVGSLSKTIQTTPTQESMIVSIAIRVSVCGGRGRDDVRESHTAISSGREGERGAEGANWGPCPECGRSCKCVWRSGLNGFTHSHPLPRSQTAHPHSSPHHQAHPHSSPHHQAHPHSSPHHQAPPHSGSYKRPIYHCKHCKAILHSLSEYEDHLTGHVKSSQLRCNVCGRQYMSVMRLWTHHRKHHRKLRPLFRHHGNKSVLGVWSSLRPRPRRHRRRNLNKVYKCTNCSERFSDHKQFRNHTCRSPSPVTPDPNKPLMIPRSPQNTSRRSRHGYKCVLCGKVLARSDTFNNHMNLHTGRCPYSCSRCGEKFPNQSRRRVHSCRPGKKRRVHNVHQVARKQVTLSSCSITPCHDDTTPHTPLLARRERKRETRRKRDSFVCGVCGTTLQHYPAYMTHMVRHETNSPLTPLITMETERKSCRLEDQQGRPLCHDKIQSKQEKERFPCRECAKSYKHLSDLRKHEYFSHPPPRPPTYMRLRRMEHNWSYSDEVAPGNQSAGPTDPSPVATPEPTVRVDGQGVESESCDVVGEGRVRVLPVCGEVIVEREGEQAEAVLKKHGSWSVFYFNENPVS